MTETRWIMNAKNIEKTKVQETRDQVLEALLARPKDALVSTRHAAEFMVQPAYRVEQMRSNSNFWYIPSYDMSY